MKTRKHDGAIAVTAYSNCPEFDNSVIVKSFVIEFDEFWDASLEFSEYMQGNIDTIQKIVAANVSRPKESLNK